MTPHPSTAKSLSSHDLSGRTLGDYHLLRRLGRGAMAEVYLAQQVSLNRRVAVKVLKQDLAADDTYVRRFEMEAQAAAALVHANIVQIYEVGSEGTIRYIAQEYVDGQNLHELIVRQGTPEVRLVVSVMRQVASALHRASLQGIVHRDIKPENILLTQSGEVKVADFGLARVTGQSQKLNLTQVGVTMGTPLYMSPEQVEGRPLDSRSDLYSLGVTCYEMLAGTPPFGGDTALSVAVQHLKKDPEPLQTLLPHVPPELCAIVHKLLEKEPDKRYTSPRELLRDLRSLQQQGYDAGEDELELWAAQQVTPSTALEATQRLDNVMRTMALETQPRSRSLLFWLVLAAAFGVGALIAWGNREPWLLAQGDAPAVRLEDRGSAKAQLWYARSFNTKEHLLSVEEFYPDAANEIRLARHDLAWLYLEEDDYDQAMQIFTEFAKLGGVDEDHKAFGLAGQALVLSIEHNYEASQNKLAELWPLRDRLSSRMGSMLLQAAAANRRALQSQEEDRWSEWLDEHFESS